MLRHPPSARPRLIELAGPAGVGKSTLSRTLRGRWQAEQGTIWGLPAMALLGSGIRLGPMLLSMCLNARSPLWDESRHIVRLRTLHRRLGQGDRTSDMLICDEGPVFALAWLRGFGHPSLRRGESDAWWRASLAQWSQTLDAVVVLDAPDSLLAQRIRTRPEWHEVKQASDREISVWMERFRRALEWVLAGLTVQGGPVVVRIATDGEDPEWIAERLLAGLRPNTHDD
jgi:broad-specificity NMP kinase